MGSAEAVLEIDSDDDAIPVAGKIPKVPSELASHPRPQDCNGVGEGLDDIDPSAFKEFLASMLDDKKAACDVAAADDGDDDNCVVLDGDPDKAVVVVNEERPGQADPEELQIISEKGELACRDFPHPRHLCVSMLFRTNSRAEYCAMCHCYVCDSPAPCAFWGSGTKPTDHCNATDKDAKWNKMRQSFRHKNMPASKRKGIRNFFQPISPAASLHQYTGDHLSVQQPLPSTLARHSPVGFSISNIESHNQQLMHPLIGVPRNVGQTVMQEASSPRANISHKRFRSDGADPRVYSSTNINHLGYPVSNSVLVQSVPSAAQSQPASSAVFHNSLGAARPLRGYSPQNPSSTPVISQELRVHPTSHHQVAPGISQGLQVQPTSYLQVDPGRVVSAELQLSRCSSLPTQGIQCQQDPWADLNKTKLNEALANLASELGVSDYNIDPPMHQQLPSTQPSQLHAQMKPGHLPTQATSRHRVETNRSHAAASSQIRTRKCS
ncbi:uncharacterized protein LOC102704601 [Oryza brachyantha]|uniref:RPM1 interacting protein 13 n=1 Tax=Oryza brachyantha TaxID=4533 RepID=J3LJV2_ORYBR|nr:uncharacterized protein LOC102704601 [Oryza brachyantha]